MENLMYKARYNQDSAEFFIDPIIVIRDTGKFVFLKDGGKLKKITEDHRIFDFFVQAKNYLMTRMIDDIDTLAFVHEKLEVEIEKLKRMKNFDDNVDIEFRIVHKIKKDKICFSGLILKRSARNFELFLI